MGSNSRYDKTRHVGEREEAEARALYMIGDLVGDYPGISSRDVAGQVAQELQATAIELGNGRSVPIELRRAVRGLADALRREMETGDNMPSTPFQPSRG
jgi:hypothetical protein